MQTTKYECKKCELVFERVKIEEGEEVKCPICGGKDLQIKEEGEKQPASCSTSSKYTCL